MLVARSSRVRPPEAAPDEGEAIDETLELIAVVEAKAGEPQSPLGPVVAQAVREGYVAIGKARQPAPYNGYYYRILTK